MGAVVFGYGVNILSGSFMNLFAFRFINYLPVYYKTFLELFGETPFFGLLARNYLVSYWTTLDSESEDEYSESFYTIWVSVLFDGPDGPVPGTHGPAQLLAKFEFEEVELRHHFPANQLVYTNDYRSNH
jgi:hypothetical protein